MKEPASIFLLNAGIDDGQFKDLASRIQARQIKLTVIQSLAPINALRRGDNPVWLLVAASSRDRAAFQREIAALTQLPASVFCIMISGEIPATDYKALLQSGRADWVQLDTAPQDLELILHTRRDHFSTPAGKGPTVISLVPSAGGVGNATIAAELAINLISRGKTKNHRICIIDLDFQTSHICDHFDLEPRLKIDEIAHEPERLDSQLLDLFASRHTSGVDIFAVPRNRSQLASIDLNVLDALLELIAQKYDLILIDHPVGWSSWTAHVLQASQDILVTGINTIPGLRQIANVLEALHATQASASRIGIILNRTEMTFLGKPVQRDHVDAVFSNERVFYVRNSPMAVESINIGQPMSLRSKSQKTVKDIAKVADFCLTQKGDAKS
ncbi:AAA family ATPase [Methylovirgula sp. 4M-Z18]|uniref:AAA family ATPase n=1 Tax=Methylovirgula sp. 4M-Z18 TaxID=2293567 RepID=UPI000E2F54F7|nr:AAA family ATPase [Methylovirgula sp. 4M-Z18]RFB75498.1 hypothetical protein DYH55_22480 [Methylovirgula sp. 4M-Z18]